MILAEGARVPVASSVLECVWDDGGARVVFDDAGWEVVLVTLERGCVAEALLSAALPLSWELMIATALRNRMTRACDGGIITGPGVLERFSIQCCGSKEQLVGRITEATQVRVQRMRGAGLWGETAMTNQVQSSSESVVVHNVSAVDVLCSRAASVTRAELDVVLWRLDEVCSSEDDPDEVKSGAQRLVHWLQRHSQAEGGRLSAVVQSGEKLAGPLRAAVPALMLLPEPSTGDAGRVHAALHLALRGVVGAEEAKSVLASLLVGEGLDSVILVGPGGTGKTMLCSACSECVPCVRGTLSTLVQCYIGESERSLGTMFALARQNGALVVLDDADALLSGPTGRGLELQLSRELQRGGCRTLLTCSTLSAVPAALVSRVVLLAQPDGNERQQLFSPFCAEGVLLDELVRRTEHFSHAECVRLARLVKLCGDDAESALAMTGPFV